MSVREVKEMLQRLRQQFESKRSPVLWTKAMNKICLGKADFRTTLYFQGSFLSRNLENRLLSASRGFDESLADISKSNVDCLLAIDSMD
jgi:hypothetical protein